MLRTVICDDEQPALDLLGDLLVQTGDVELLGAYQNAADALGVINNGGVDLAFFDVEMPELSGVEAASEITAEPKPLLVFATAHPEYAVDAFGIDAIDFVLKPFDSERIAKSVQKAERMLALIKASGDATDQLASKTEAGDTSDVLKINDGGSIYFVPLNEIIWIEAAGDYSVIHRLEKELAVRRTISSLETELAESGFFRVHRSHIIAKEHVSSVRRLAKGEAEFSLSNGITVRSSRSYGEKVSALTS